MKHNDQLVDYLTQKNHIESKRIEKAFRKVDRAKFTDQKYPYKDRPIYLDQGSTISAPHIVAQMLEILQPRGKVLEMGSGSGYVQALLVELAGKVIGVERNQELVKKSREKVPEAHIIHGDSIPDEQFDRILYSFATKDFQKSLEKSPIVVVPEIIDGSQVLKRYKNGEEKSFNKVKFVKERKGLKK